MISGDRVSHDRQTKWHPGKTTEPKKEVLRTKAGVRKASGI